ncbi:hypothetical protein GIB67_030594, partial [Kingdonia uniflora]
ALLPEVFYSNIILFYSNTFYFIRTEARFSLFLLGSDCIFEECFASRCILLVF